MILFKKLILYILIKNKLSKYLYKNSKDANQIINKNIFNFLKLVKREYIDFNCSFFFKNFILSTFFKRFFLFNNYFMNLIFFKKFSFPKKKNFNFFKIFKKRFKKLNLIASETKKPKNQEKKIEKKYEKKKIKKKKLKKSKSLFKIRARTKINNFNIDNNYYLIKYNNLFNFFLSKKKFKLNDSKKKVRYLIFCFKNIFFLKNAYKPNKYEMHKPVSFVKVTATKLNKKKFFFFKQKEIFFFKNNLKLIQKIKNKFLIGILIPDNMQIFLEQIKFNFYLFFKNNFLLQPINDLILGFNKNSFEFYEDINLNLFFNFFFKNI
jgi:hypothetical protein